MWRFLKEAAIFVFCFAPVIFQIIVETIRGDIEDDDEENRRLE
jgi:hypothetical protein